MSVDLYGFRDVEDKLLRGDTLTRDEADRLMSSSDLLSVGLLGEAARKHRTGERVTFGRVCLVPGSTPGAGHGEAGEVRLTGTLTSIDEARQRVRDAAATAGDVPVTGFSLADLLALAGHDHLALADIARVLRADGLVAVAEVPIDGLGSLENAVEVVRAVTHGGLGAWRVTVERAAPAERIARAEAVNELQRQTGAVRAFAPLPRHDSAEAPSTGYDDVRTVAMTSALCSAIPFIQVDWPLYGPKLAQVAIGYGANDIDGIEATDTLNLGPRRSPAEDIARQIRAAMAAPVERNGCYAVRG